MPETQTPGGVPFDLAQFKTMDAMLRAAPYDESVLTEVLPYVQAYMQTRVKLRELPLGEAHSATTMLAGGKP